MFGSVLAVTPPKLITTMATPTTVLLPMAACACEVVAARRTTSISCQYKYEPPEDEEADDAGSPIVRDLIFMFNGPLGFFIFVALTTFLFGSAPSYVPREFGSVYPIEELPSDK